VIIAVDFDGVIHNYRDVVPGRKMGKPFPGAIETLVQWHQAGHEIVVHTVRGNTVSGMKSAVDWLNYFDVPYHSVTAFKPNADVFLDDRAVRFTDWAQAAREIGEMA
jgi:phosphoglycolate phosphatase-like HAD superfamily hydrolase